MDDQQRLNKVVKWMNEVADPWMHDAASTLPHPGSDLAVDDAEGPATSALSHRGIIMALDHLGAVVDTVTAGPPRRLKAPFTVLRTALTCGTRVCWLLEPDSSADRRLRGIQYRYENLEEQRKAMTDFSEIPLTDEQDVTVAGTLAAIELERQALEAGALTLGASRLTKPTSMTKMLKDMVDLATHEGAGIVQLWRTGSASAHGHYWADDLRDNPATFDHKWFQPAIQGTFLMINNAMNLRHRRATSRSA